MTTLALYIALYIWFWQDRAINYCMEEQYVNQYIEAKLTGDEFAILYAEQIMEEQEKVCSFILEANTSNLENY